MNYGPNKQPLPRVNRRLTDSSRAPEACRGLRMFGELLYRPGQSGSVTTKPHAGMIYRPEIDGLRALAVVPVIFFHAHLKFFGVEPFRGGYVGVDIFFVISGYLIAGIIFDELKKGRFSLARFFERPPRRI